ncbi:hypothetical protein SKAU_G00119090 [Synaphobranchus kaupii]|uniref:Uncharacterized protein n=1 Tax=Synaphobranchus kaupii TaxID=118154 RepID=A0A9Q1J280_SYNKA|nr:hypothetical protein SKAU_G00119090 [Synaphobranchus kaupii]
MTVKYLGEDPERTLIHRVPKRKRKAEQPEREDRASDVYKKEFPSSSTSSVFGCTHLHGVCLVQSVAHRAFGKALGHGGSGRKEKLRKLENSP